PNNVDPMGIVGEQFRQSCHVVLVPGRTTVRIASSSEGLTRGVPTRLAGSKVAIVRGRACLSDNRQVRRRQRNPFTPASSADVSRDNRVPGTLGETGVIARG